MNKEYKYGYSFHPDSEFGAEYDSPIYDSPIEAMIAADEEENFIRKGYLDVEHPRCYLHKCEKVDRVDGVDVEAIVDKLVGDYEWAGLDYDNSWFEMTGEQQMELEEQLNDVLYKFFEENNIYIPEVYKTVSTDEYIWNVNVFVSVEAIR